MTIEGEPDEEEYLKEAHDGLIVLMKELGYEFPKVEKAYEKACDLLDENMYYHTSSLLDN